MLRGTNRIPAFLDQFSNSPRHDIERVLSLLKVVTLSQLQEDIALEIYRIISTDYNIGTIESNLIIESMISQEDITSHLDEASMESRKNASTDEKLKIPKKTINSYLSLSGNYAYNYVAYRDFLPSKARHYESGSELLGDLTRREVARRFRLDAKRDWFVKEASPDFSQFSNLHLILVADNIGSGKQAITFLYSMISGVKLNIPHSSKVSVTIVAWGATIKAIEVINKEFKALRRSNSEFKNYEFELIYLNYIRTLYELSDSTILDQFSAALKTYKPKLRKAQILGYTTAATLTVFEGSACPNTIPQVFFNDAVCDKPIFKNKNVYAGFSADLARLKLTQKGSLESFQDHNSKSFNRLGLSSIKRLSINSNNPTWQLLVYSSAGYSPEVSRALIDATHAAIIDSERNLHAQGWIDVRGRITEMGSKALTEFARQNRGQLSPSRYTRRKKVEVNKYEYYPRSIDGVS